MKPKVRFSLCFYCNHLITSETNKKYYKYFDPKDHYNYKINRKSYKWMATKDHLMPKSLGGSRRLNNIVVCCSECNTQKGNLTLEEYRLVCAQRSKKLKSWKRFKFPGELNNLTENLEVFKENV